MIEIKEDGH